MNPIREGKQEKAPPQAGLRRPGRELQELLVQASSVVRVDLGQAG